MFSANLVSRSLTPREEEVLDLLIAGDSNKQIANLLDITEATVKMHVKNILTKIRLKNRTQAAVWALKDEGRQLRRSRAA
jgi:two-component system nitrate/nitrite response regulator NarL